MTSTDLVSALGDSQEVELTTTGRISGEPSSRPVWFAHQGGHILLLPVDGSHSQWYKNVVKTPSIGLRTGGTNYVGTGRPITDPADVDTVIEAFRQKYGAEAIESYYPRRDVAVAVTSG